MTRNTTTARLPPAVIVGLDCITGLQTARILAGGGVPVVALTGDPGHFACRTKVCDRIIHADLKSGVLIDALVGLGPQLDARGVLFPCSDLAVLLVSAARERLQPWYRVVLPDHDVVEMLVDKARFADYARELGVDVPATYTVTDYDTARVAAAGLRYPAVVKPAVKTAAWQRHTKAKVIPAASPADVMRIYDETRMWTDTLIAQSWIPGGDSTLYSCNCYFDSASRPQATFVARKLRQWPPRTGTSASGEEVRNDVVLETTLKLFSGVAFRGLGYVEMKRDPDGRHWVIEPNVGRPTGRSAIAEAGGVPLLMTQYLDALGVPLPEPRVQRYLGTKWVDDRRDMLAALYYLAHRELSVRDWRSSLRGHKAHAVVSAADPWPFAAEIGQSLRKVAQRAADSVRTGPSACDDAA